MRRTSQKPRAGSGGGGEELAPPVRAPRENAFLLQARLPVCEYEEARVALQGAIAVVDTGARGDRPDRRYRLPAFASYPWYALAMIFGVLPGSIKSS